MSAASGPRIILGLDYGTTNTGLAWAQSDGVRELTPDDVLVFKKWPGNEAKIVPSAISYSRSPNAKKQWGWSIDDNSRVLRWTKLEFEHRSITKELEVLEELIQGLDRIKELQMNDDAATMRDIPKDISKSAEDIVRDYLIRVAREWYSHMRTVGVNTLDVVPLDIVLTHPATWSDEAMNKTYRAVVGAFPKTMFPTLREISFTSEPEAWALYTVQDMLRNDRSTLIPGECFVICDAGGGTVDLVSYRIDKVDPLKITRVGGLTGLKCGATFIDRAFLEWLQPRLQNLDILPQDYTTGGHLVLMPKGRVLLERFEKVKHAFTGTGSAKPITLPRGTLVNPEYESSIVNGVISLTEQEMKSFFATTVKKSLNLIARQIAQVEASNNETGIPYQVTNIFLAGGFAENEYFFKEVDRYASSFGDKQVHRADDCWVGVAKGAVLRGVGIGMTKSAPVNSCPRHYGICISNTDDPEENVRIRKVDDQIYWLIKQGDVILPDKSLRKTMNVGCMFTSQQINKGGVARIVFTATNMPTAPRYLDKLPRAKNEVVDLDINSQDIEKSAFRKQNKPGGGVFHVAYLKVEIKVYRDVSVTIRHGSKVLVSHTTNL